MTFFENEKSLFPGCGIIISPPDRVFSFLRTINPQSEFLSGF